MRRNLSRLAQFSISRVVLELQREQHQSQAVKFDIGVRLEIRMAAMVAGKIIGANGDKIRHSRRKNGKLRYHAVFLTGWFSATAPELSTRTRAFAQEFWINTLPQNNKTRANRVLCHA
jgi:hypothetical protein